MQLNQKKTISTLLGEIEIGFSEQEGIRFYENGGIRKISTLRTAIRVSSEDSEQIVSPVKVQSCMHPERISYETIDIYFSENGFLDKIIGKYERYYWKHGDQVKAVPWQREIAERKCGDCINCKKCW